MYNLKIEKKDLLRALAIINNLYKKVGGTMLLYQRQPPQRNCQIVKLPLCILFIKNKIFIYISFTILSLAE